MDDGFSAEWTGDEVLIVAALIAQTQVPTRQQHDTLLPFLAYHAQPQLLLFFDLFPHEQCLSRYNTKLINQISMKAITVIIIDDLFFNTSVSDV